jgi:hypothetical protein
MIAHLFTNLCGKAAQFHLGMGRLVPLTRAPEAHHRSELSRLDTIRSFPRRLTW